MVVVGELEGLISNHGLLISRGEIPEAGKVKELIGEYLSKKDRIARLYRGITEKLEEFISCAESNFEKFQEIINYKMLTQLEYFYPEYFEELSENIEDSAKKQMVSGEHFYAGLLLGSSRTADNKILSTVIDYFLTKRMYPQLERVFDRLEETRQSLLSLNAEDGKEVEISLFSETKIAKEVGAKIFDAYSQETTSMESQTGWFTYAQNAYLLANILSARLPELELLSDSSLVSSGIIYFKELTLRSDIDNTGELVRFIDDFKNNPAAKHFAEENPELFRNYLNSPDLKKVLDDLVRNLLGKTRFDEVNQLSLALEQIVSFTSIFNDHLTSLKESGFFVLAIEMAEKLQLKEALTEELKLEAFRTLMQDYEASQTKANWSRLRNFCAKHGIDCDKFPQLTKEVTDQLEAIERLNPEGSRALNQLYTLLHLERRKAETFTFNPFKLFEPVFLFFGWIFRIFLRIIMAIAYRTTSLEENKKTSTNLKTKR